MASQTATHSLTVRLSQDLYTEAAEAARRQSKSLNALIQQGLESILREEEAKYRYDSYTMLGDDPEESHAMVRK